MRESLAPVLIVVVVGAALGATAFAIFWPDPEDAEAGSAPDATTTTVASNVIDTTMAAEASTTTTVETTTTTEPARARDTVPAWTVGEAWGTTVGVTMFRGNPTRTFYGSGPVPNQPEEAWRYPGSPMCATSSVGGESTVWCGMGWTGQPVLHERDDGVTELIFGAYDRSVHFVDSETGLDSRQPFPTGDIIKGSVTLDPDGYPLLYFGSRDNKLRIVALDRDVPEELWALDASAVDGIWNNDWDGNPLILDDILYEGGENGWFFAYELNREIDVDGLVQVSPEQLVAMPGYDDDLISKSGRNVSIESSVAVFDQRVYFTNSGGRVIGLDISNVRAGEAPIVFDFYAGGDIDATPVVDADGHLYVAIEHEPSQMSSIERERNRQVGQLVKLDPYRSDDPRLWGVDLVAETGADSGLWSTPALHQGMLYVNTHLGDLIAVDAETGEIVWSEPVGFHSWSSPAVVDGELVVATCLGELRGYSLADPASPVRLWTMQASTSCLEATPIVWDGSIYLGSRDGYMRAFR